MLMHIKYKKVYKLFKELMNDKWQLTICFKEKDYE